MTKRDKIRPLLWPSTTPAYNEQGRFTFHTFPEMSLLEITERPQNSSFLWVRIPVRVAFLVLLGSTSNNARGAMHSDHKEDRYCLDARDSEYIPIGLSMR